MGSNESYSSQKPPQMNFDLGKFVGRALKTPPKVRTRESFFEIKYLFSTQQTETKRGDEQSDVIKWGSVRAVRAHNPSGGASVDSLHLQVLGASGAPGHPPDLTSGRRQRNQIMHLLTIRILLGR